MNREIIFRGKTLQGGEWIAGDYMRYAGGAMIWVHDPDGGTYNVLVDRATVGQYTGLKDKSGVKIFEGDIVRLVHDWHDGTLGGWVAAVEFGNPNGTYSWGWQLKYIRGEANLNRDILLWVDMEATSAFCEVIGNVIDDPELLEREETI